VSVCTTKAASTPPPSQQTHKHTRTWSFLVATYNGTVVGPCSSSGSWSPAFHRGGPGTRTSQVMWDLWWTMRHWRRFYSSTSVSLAKYSTDCSTVIIIRGWYNRSVVVSVIVDSVPFCPPKREGNGTVVRMD
jgi:hypothetical protein